MSTTQTPSSNGFQPQTKIPLNNSDSEQSPLTTPTSKSSLAPQTEAQKVAAVGDILSGNPVQSDTSERTSAPDVTAGGNDAPSEFNGFSDGAGDEAASGISEGMSVKDLATQLGTSPKALYENLEIGLGDGETITLSEMKSQFKQQATATREHAERDQQLSQREAQMLENLQLLQSVQDDLADKLSPQMVRQLQERTQKQERAEQALLFNAVPELRDSAKLDNFRADITEAMAPFGFQAHELVIRDHRIALAMRDYVRVKKQLDSLLELDPERQQQKPPKSHKPQRGNAKQAAKQRRTENLKRARGGNEAQKAAAVTDLLRGSANG